MSKLIPLRGNKYPNQFAIVDEEDYEYLMGFHWLASNAGSTRSIYATRYKSPNGQISMHREIMMEMDPKIIIDHINHNGIDNRRSNLRRATRQQNVWNNPIFKTNKNGLKGAIPVAGGFKSAISVTQAGVRSHIELGIYPTEDEAAQSYNVAARILFGEFACLNPVTEADESIKSLIFSKLSRFTVLK